MSIPALEALARKYMDFQNAVRKSPRRYDAHVLEQMLHLPELSPAEREDTERLNRVGQAARDVAEHDDLGGPYLHRDAA